MPGRTPVIGAVKLAQLASGLLFLTGMGTGVWKYRAMITDADGQAPVYVDVCHRAALMYAFACLVLAEFARLSVWPERVNLAAVATPVLFFALAVLSYAIHGVFGDTDNQLRRPHRLGRGQVHSAAISLFIYALTAGEIGGFLVLFAGSLPGLLA
ncbi:hypothetical protein [Caulobacter sp. FWC2]|uniref:hypothetical protein n=1 Tax=Caulobacter sp. FWC2 TaxID=69664 RepID=UPI000C1539FC|nr:hypothetical protein [Caulobacter sp. FWC2]PIB92575.1 hypothetical protein CSW62_13945 [Caulobacter sp. FWC2]